MSGHADAMHCADIVDGESPSHLNGNFLAPAMKFPVERPACFGIPKLYALVSSAFKLGRLFGAALALEIGGCCDGQDARFEQLSRHEAGRSRPPNLTQGQIRRRSYRRGGLL